MSYAVEQALQHWQYIQPIVSVPRNEKEYKKLATHLDELLEVCSEDEDHPAWGLVNLISGIIEEYDQRHYKIPEASGVSALKYLMKEHQLNQNDMKELGSQGVVSEIINGKRELNIRQLKALSKKFNVSIDTFL